MPFFSIIIPVYNVASYLRECLDSVLAQTFTDWEAICIDDGSTDGSGVILDEYAAKDDRFRVLHQTNAGVSIARNYGLSGAKGEWLLFADADDAYRVNAFSEIAKLVSSDRYDAYFFARPPEWYGDEILPTCGGKIITSLDTPQTGKPLLLNCDELLGFPHIRCFRSSMFKQVQFPPRVEMMEDTINLIHCLAIKARWALTNLQPYLYRVRTDSASRAVPIGRPEAVMETVLCCIQDAKRLLRLNDDETAVYAKSHWKVLHRYLWDSFASPQGRNLRGIVERYMKIEAVSNTRILAPTMRLRCLIAYLFNKPIGFKLIRFMDYVIYGLGKRLLPR